MPKLTLDLNLDDDEESLNINEDYAKRYDNWRRLEEIQKIKDKHGKDADKLDEEEESEDESTDSDELIDWSVQKDRDFLKTYAALKAKDPRIYNEDTKFFNDEEGTSHNEDRINKSPNKKEEKKKPKAMFLRDYEQKLVLERDGKFSDEDDDGEEMPKDEGYFEQQKKIIDEIKSAIKEDSDSDDGFLKQRVKTDEEKKHEEDDYYTWLKGHKSTTVDVKDENLKKLKEKWSQPDLEEEDKFLKNYLVNKLYEEDDDTDLPTYDEIVEIDEQDKKTADFEHRYNFRFEDPDQDFIKQYPRTIKESVRQGNEKRKATRKSQKERKTEEKRQKKEEIKQLKAMKRKELEEMLKKVRDVTGDPNLPITIEDLEKEFDPDDYSKRMEALFNSEYYSETVDDEKKPEFSDSESEADGESDYDQLKIVGGEVLETSSHNGHEENSDDDEQQPGTSSGRPIKISRRKRKRNTKFLEAVANKKPLFDPKKKSFDEYFKEYYGLDYEDIIAGDLMTRFKYRNVPANNFGLTVEEILTADDKQLNSWVSVKKASQYRSEQEEKLDQNFYQRKAQNLEKKQKILGKIDHLSQPPSKKPKLKNDEQKRSSMKTDKPVQQKLKKKKLKKNSLSENVQEPPQKILENGISNKTPKSKKAKDEPVQEPLQKSVENVISNKTTKSKKARRKKKNHLGNLTKERLQAYGVRTKDLKRRLYVQNQNPKNVEK